MSNEVSYNEKMSQSVSDGEKYIKPNVKPKFDKPAFKRNPNAKSYQRTAVAVSPNAPTDVSFEDLMHMRSVGTSFFRELKVAFRLLQTTIKNPSKENKKLMIIGLVFFVIWIWTKYIPGNFTYMMPGGIKSVLAVGLATFNNVPTRVLHFSSIMTLLAAYSPVFGKSTRSFMGNVKSSIVVIKSVVSNPKGKIFSICLASFGIGFIMANYMMRNNSSNKYVACLTLGLTMLLATSGMMNSTFVKLSKSLIMDLTKLLKMNDFFTTHQMTIQVGIGLALVASYILCLIRGAVYSSVTDNLGYILGVIIFVIGTVKTIGTK